MAITEGNMPFSIIHNPNGTTTYTAVDSITKEINSGRRVEFVGPSVDGQLNESKVTAIDFLANPPKGYNPTITEYCVSSEPCTSIKEAIASFWEDYKKKDIPEGGSIYWRRNVEYVNEYSFEHCEDRHIIRGRFHIDANTR